LGGEARPRSFGKEAMSENSSAFYCVANSIYFLGAVALVNSLRLLGHAEPIFVLDCGLTDSQRSLLAREATVVAAPEQAPPWLSKPAAPLRHPAEVMVLMDADVIVTRSLGELVETAATGRVVAVEHGSHRFFAEWGSLLGLRAPRRQPYVSSSLVVLGRGVGREVLALMERSQARAPLGESPFAAVDPKHGLLVDVRPEAMENPFFFPDQDVLNAVLAAEIDRDRLVVLDRRLEAIPPFRGLRVVDEVTLRCRYEDGLEPFAVHHVTAKPWLEPTPHGVYTQLLMRLLRRRDVAIRVRQRDLPPHLQTGPRGVVSRKLEGVLAQVRGQAR
jgi:hypothetical protein